ncbi:MFS transporter [Virgisporangium aurantiacum]|uniref:MFS transporter n=1 Tax=Virgisporangium aurantiacum TaxID=175570 RepID=A0A8J4E3X2_9ACTN|nr:MFS transporter [Virgisporangium aurantiacum]GIJ60566.1 MFS transporter [Virgisporangium aurantiacum]
MNRYRWVILAVGAGAQGAAAAYYFGLATIAPALRADYDLSLTGLGLLLAAPMLGLLLTLVRWGQASDRFGERPVMVLALAGCAAALAIAPLGPLPLVFVALVAAGAAVSGVNSASGRVVLTWFPARGRGMAMAIRQSAVPLGSALAAATLPTLAAHGGSRAALWAIAGLEVVTAVAVAIWVREPADAVRTTGSAARTRVVDMLRNVPFMRVSLAGSLLALPQVVITAFGVELLHDRAGYAPATAAALLAVSQVGGAGARVLAGWWSDRAGSRLRPFRLIAYGIAGSFAVLAPVLTLESAVVGAVLVTAGVLAVCWNGLVFVAAGEMAPPGRTGAFLGLQNTAMFGAVMLASVAVGALADVVGWPVTVLVLIVPAVAAGWITRPVPEPPSPARVG